MASISKYKTKKGDFYRIQLYAGKDANGKRIVKTVRGFKTKREAKMAADKLSAEIASGKVLKKSGITFSEVYEQWLDSYSLSVREQTLVNVEILFRRHIVPFLGSSPIQKITVSQCQRMINEYARSGFTSTKRCISYASKLFKFAISMDYIDKNPFDKLIVPKVSKKNNIENFYTKQELERFMSVAEKRCPRQIYTLFRLLAFTGMRKGEALALTWSDIDFKHASVTINKTIAQGKNNRKFISQTKTAASNRIVYIDKKTLSVLESWKKQQRKILFERGYNSNNVKQLVFSSRHNSQMTHTIPNDWIKKVGTEAGIHIISVHGLRHTYATLAIQSGMNPKELQVQLGHSNIQTTLQIYTAITEEQRIATPDKFTNFVSF